MYKKKVCIFGQGFVGLPLALSFALRGYYSVGVDVDEKLVDKINRGETSLKEKYKGKNIQQILKQELKKKSYVAVKDAEKAVKNCNNIIVTVGLPINQGSVIMSALEEACIVIGKNLKKQDLIIIRSTVIPGTTEEFIKPILEKESGLKAGVDFYLGYASERIAEGNAFDEFENMPTLVGAVNDVSLNKAVELLGVVCKAEIISAPGIKEVETAKLFENIQRDVNIALCQEFARFTEALGVDIFEVVKLANTHSRVNLLIPGSGVGGYCIPNAYHYLAGKGKELGLSMELLKLARENNAKLPEYIVKKTEEMLLQKGKELKGSKVGVLGLAMKDYSNDDRVSPPVDICRKLIERGAVVQAFDPAVSGEYEFKVKTQEEAVIGTDAVLILAKQQGICFQEVENMIMKMNNPPVCIDVKAAMQKELIINQGIKYWRI